MFEVQDLSMIYDVNTDEKMYALKKVKSVNLKNM